MQGGNKEDTIWGTRIYCPEGAYRGKGEEWTDHGTRTTSEGKFAQFWRGGEKEKKRGPGGKEGRFGVLNWNHRGDLGAGERGRDFCRRKSSEVIQEKIILSHRGGERMGEGSTRASREGN